jgi:hypothetical protein
MTPGIRMMWSYICKLTKLHVIWLFKCTVLINFSHTHFLLTHKAKKRVSFLVPARVTLNPARQPFFSLWKEHKILKIRVFEFFKSVEWLKSYES